MPKKRCSKKGGTLKEAVVAVFKFVTPNVRNEWYVYLCECGKHHITNNPK